MSSPFADLVPGPFDDLVPYDPLAAFHPRPATAKEIAALPPSAKAPIIPRAAADVTQTPATSDRGTGTPLAGIAGRIAKNLVNPMLENPIQSAVLSAAWPVGLALTAKGLAENVGGYAGQKAAELTLPPDVRALAEQDPTRIEGADVATQLAAAAALPLLHAGYNAITPDIGAAVPEAFSDLAQETGSKIPVDPEVVKELFQQNLVRGREAFDQQQAEAAQTAQNTAFSDLLSDLPTAKEAKQLAKTPPVEGLETPEASVQDIASQKIADQVSAQAKAEAAAEATRLANEAAAKQQFQEALGSRTPLGVELGVVRRPAGEPVPAPTPDAPFADLVPQATEPHPVDLPPTAPEPTQTAIEPHAVTLPRYPEGMAMGGLEGRIPELPKPNVRGNPEVPGTAVTPEVANALGEAPERAAPLPAGEPKEVGAAGLLNRSPFAARNQAALNDAIQQAYGEGLDKTRVSFAEQGKVRQAFADAIGVDRLQIDPTRFGKLSGPEIVALKDVMTRNFDQIDAISKRLAQGDLPVGDAEILNEELDRLRAQNQQHLEGIVRGSEQIGRDLGYLRQMASHTLDPDTWVIQAKKLAGDRLLSDETIAEIRKLAREAMELCA